MLVWFFVSCLNAFTNFQVHVTSLLSTLPEVEIRAAHITYNEMESTSSCSHTTPSCSGWNLDPSVVGDTTFAKAEIITTSPTLSQGDNPMIEVRRTSLILSTG